MTKVARARNNSVRPIPMDATLREQTFKMIGVYGKAGAASVRSALPEVSEMVEELLPQAMKSLSGLIKAYDKGQMTISEQKKLIRLMKGYVKKAKVC